MRQLSWWLASSLALVALGCSGGGAHTPVTPGAEHPAGPAPSAASDGLGAVYQNGDISQSALGLYIIDIDPSTYAATVSLKATRTGQANDDVYALAIDNFLRGDSIRVRSISNSGTTLDLTYAVAHPFPGPSDPTGTPNGSTNRADLCISGFTCFLMDVASATGNTYFTDRVANTAAVTNADAYFSPEGMITFGGTANTFPYKLLVDEIADSRGNGISNGGDVTGNYGADGWTRAEFGTNNDGWTGYGILAQGQVSTNTVSLDLNDLLANGFSFDVAVIAKYNDPRMGVNAAAKRANRLPPASPDSSLFAYRMPHGALDVSRIRFISEDGGFIQDQVSAAVMDFHVTDWDARATETSETDLENDTTVTNVAIGESGLPTLDLCIPGVLGDESFVDTWDPGATVQDDDSLAGGDVDQDSGQEGDPLYYNKSVTKTVTSGQTPGDYVGMIRATDVEDPALWVPLDEGTPPLPLASNLPSPVTYQAFPVTLMSNNTAPTGSYAITTPTVVNGGTVSIEVTGLADAENDDIDVMVDWDDDGVYTLAGTVTFPYAAVNPFTSPITYTHGGSDPDTRDLPVRLVGTSPTDLTTQTFDVVLFMCPTAPYVATDITDLSELDSYLFYFFAGVFPTRQANDMEAWRSTTWSVNGGAVAQRAGEINAFGNTLLGSLTVTPLTSGMTAGNVFVEQIDVDSSANVFYSTIQTHPGGTFVANPNHTYGASGGQADIRYFSSTGGVVDYSSHTVISTAGNRVVAMEVDEAGNVYYIDTNNVLHRHLATASYAEDTAYPYPIDLKTISQPMDPNGGTAATNIKIFDFERSEYSEAFFILAQSQEASTSNGYLYKVACDGTTSSRTAGFALNYSTTQSEAADLFLDQRGSTGALLPTISDGDAQIVVAGNRKNPTTDTEPEWRLFNANLQLNASEHNPNNTNFAPVTFCIVTGNLIITANGPNFGNAYCTVWYPPGGGFPPTGWQ